MITGAHRTGDSNERGDTDRINEKGKGEGQDNVAHEMIPKILLTHHIS